MHTDELFENYELLLPAPHEGGYLILALYHSIRSKELSEQFSTEDIKLIMEKIAHRFNNGSKPQVERIIRQLLHYCLRNVPDQYGKFLLSEHAIRLVELMEYRLENPYKNYPLKETFEKFFVLRNTDTKSITDLETRFGREFVSGHKRIINDHLYTLEDEMVAAYGQLNAILNADEESATAMVRKFTNVFRTFGERAEDITYAISSKDNFLRRLRTAVEEFYFKADALKHAQTEDELAQLRRHQSEWLSASAIQFDLEHFFKTVDEKIDRIRRQILKASTKLSELQENFSRHSNFRLLLKKLYHLCLDQATGKRHEIQFDEQFPRKKLVYERIQFFHPVRYEFGITLNNRLQPIISNKEYELRQRREIEREVRQQELIAQWVDQGKRWLDEHPVLELTDFIGEVLKKEDDLFIAQNVAMDLVQYAAASPAYRLGIKIELKSFIEYDLRTWKISIQNRLAIPS